MSNHGAGRRVLASLLVAVCVAAGVAIVDAAPAAATTPPITTAAAPLPADAYQGFTSTSLADVSCGAAGFCVTVGQYFDNQSHYAPLIDTYSGGAWHATRGPVPAGTVTYPNASLTAVSCSGAGLCSALGTYNGTHEFLDTLYGGHWYAADLPFPADADVNGGLGATSIACQAPGTCYAVGNYLRNFAPMSYGHWGFIDTMTVKNGVPTWTSIVAPTPDFPPIYVENGNGAPLVYEQFGSVSCSGSGGCTAVGVYATFQDPVNQTGTSSLQGLIESLSGTTATPGWAAPISGAENADWSAWLYLIGCGHGACLATGSFSTNSPTIGYDGVFVDTNTGSGFTPTKATWPSGAATSQSAQNLRAVSCGSTASCVIVGAYVTAGVQAPMIVDAGTAIAAPAPSGGWGQYETLGAVSCASATTCLAASVSQQGVSTPSDTLEILFGTQWVATHATALPNQGTYQSGYVATACDTGQHCFAVSSYGGAIVTVGAAPKPPSVTLKTPTAPFSLASSATVSWSGVAGSSPIAHYTVQVRKAEWNGTFGNWSTPSAWASLPATTKSVAASLPVGEDTCFKVEAVDTGGRSAWSATRCTARPLDDKPLGASSHWARYANRAGFYFGTYSATSHLDATLTRTGAEFDRVALVATRCPACGVVGVYSGTTKLASIDLSHSTTVKEAVFVLPGVGQRTATITIKSVSSGKSIQIDGLGISRS